MFQQITVFSVLFNTISYCLVYSIKIGKFLVSFVSSLLDISCTIISNLFELLWVITDSLDLFILDILQLLFSVNGLFVYAWTLLGYSLFSTIKYVCIALEKLLLAVSSVHSFLECCILDTGEGIKRLLMLVKHICVLFGSGVYFTITFIPFTVWSVVEFLVDNLNKVNEFIVSIETGIMQFSKNCIINSYEFLTDVPIESAIGIVIAASLIYLFTHFNVIIVSYLYEQIWSSLLNLHDKVFRRSQQLNQMHQKQAIIPAGRSDDNVVSSPKVSSSDERYCVICQDRLKCILVLPCRHVCMCNDCNCRLQMYHNTCPICRQDIDSTMKIFI